MIKISLVKLWHSPTFNTWTNQGSMALRMVILTPLILTRFDKVEIAAYFLLGSLNFFGQILSIRLSITFSRMIAFAMGGATDLAPIAGRKSDLSEISKQGPNWEMIGRAYGTLGAILGALAMVVGIVSAGMAWFGVGNLLEGYDVPAPIWIAAGVVVLTTAINFAQSQYQVALQGINQVALSNRVQGLFNLASIVSGAAVLLLGGGFLLLICVMQAFVLMGFLRARFLLRQVEGGRFRHIREYGWDSQVARWAWEPTWKGLIAQLSNVGVLQLSGILLTGVADAGVVAAYLFSVRLMSMMTQIAQAPFSSHQPLFSKLLAAGEMEKLRTHLTKRMSLSLCLLALGISGVGLFGQPLLHLIGSKISIIEPNLWFLFGGLSLIDRLNVLSLSTSAIGNRMLYYWETAIGGVVSIGALSLAIHAGLLAIILAAMLPQLLILNVGPIKVAARTLEVRGSNFLRNVALLPSMIFGLAAGLFSTHVLSPWWKL